MTGQGGLGGRALLLSGSVGMGHDATADACGLALRRLGWAPRTLDSLRLMGDAQGAMGQRVFKGLFGRPGLYDAFHFSQLRPGGRLARLAEAGACRYAVPGLREQLRREPADLILSLFATGAAAASRVKREHPGMATVTFCTDLCPHRLWIQDNTDLYLVTSPAAGRFVRRFAPEAAVAQVPTPVRPDFLAPPSRQAARRELGIPSAAPCVLVMAGGWGARQLAPIAASLARAGIYTLVVAGQNPALEAALRSLAERQPRVLPFGFTDQVATLMAASNLVVTTAGNTCSEARVVGRHLLLLDLVPGHGRENLQHQLELGGADIAPPDPAKFPAAVRACLRNPDPAEAVSSPASSPRNWQDPFLGALAPFGVGRDLGEASRARTARHPRSPSASRA